MVTNTFAQFVATVNAGIEHINKSVSAGNAVNCGSYERVEVCASNEANAAFAMYKKLPIEVQFKLCQATAAAYYYVFNSHGATENSTLGHALRLYVSTHSHPKVAAAATCSLKFCILFQHTATRRWLPPLSKVLFHQVSKPRFR